MDGLARVAILVAGVGGGGGDKEEAGVGGRERVPAGVAGRVWVPTGVAGRVWVEAGVVWWVWVEAGVAGRVWVEAGVVFRDRAEVELGRRFGIVGSVVEVGGICGAELGIGGETWVGWMGVWVAGVDGVVLLVVG